MVGLCGIIGDHQSSAETMAEHLQWLGTETTSSYRSGSISVHHAYHSATEDQPARTEDGDVLLWIWGDVIGHEAGGEYSPKPASESVSAYCLGLYEEYGLEFIDGLNSEFAGVIYDTEDDSVVLFVDRLSARPIYYTHTGSSLVFSTQLQSIPEHPAVDPTFDMVSLCSFFQLFGRGGLGTDSILEDVHRLHPGSKLRYDMESSELDEDVYWQPKYDPLDRSYDYFLKRFTDLMEDAMVERLRHVEDPGLFLSGGSDSRLALSFLGEDVKSYHMNEYMNREATIAQQVARETGSDFDLLERHPAYYIDLLDDLGKISNYRGRLDQAHALGFKDEIQSGVTTMFSGQYSDTILRELHAPKHHIRIPKIDQKVEAPFLMDVDDEEYLSLWKSGYFWGEDELPSYFTDDSNYAETFDAHLDSDLHKSFFNVEYDSNEELVRSSYYYPITNSSTYQFYSSTLQMLPVTCPFLDNRIVDLSLRMPKKYKFRRNIVDDSLESRAPRLAKIKHPQTRQPLTRNATVQLLSRYAYGLYDLLGGGEEQSGSWPDHAENVREHGRILPIIQENEALIEACEFLDLSEVYECYNRHMSGENRLSELYSLVTFLEMPMTERVVMGGRFAD
ncbi:MAG: asparagine synthase-related protein [Natronomonas sp.]